MLPEYGYLDNYSDTTDTLGHIILQTAKYVFHMFVYCVCNKSTEYRLRLRICRAYDPYSSRGTAFDTSGRLCSHRKIEWIDFEYFQIRHYLLCIYIPTCFALHSWTLNYSTFPISSGKHKPRLRKMSSHIECFHPSCRDFPFLSKIKKVAQKPHEYAHLSLSRMTP